MPCEHLQAFLGCIVLPGDCDGKYFQAAATGKLDEWLVSPGRAQWLGATADRGAHPLPGHPMATELPPVGAVADAAVAAHATSAREKEGQACALGGGAGGARARGNMTKINELKNLHKAMLALFQAGDRRFKESTLQATREFAQGQAGQFQAAEPPAPAAGQVRCTPQARNYGRRARHRGEHRAGAKRARGRGRPGNGTGRRAGKRTRK